MRCAAEARRVVRDMGLDDRVELLGAEPSGAELPGIEMLGIELLGQDSDTTAPLKSPVRLRRPFRRTSIWWSPATLARSDSSRNGGATPPDTTPGNGGGTASS
jgi:hypothetical protein